MVGLSSLFQIKKPSAPSLTIFSKLSRDLILQLTDGFLDSNPEVLYW